VKALIIGATGLIGSQCLELLLYDDQYSLVEIWARNATANSHPKLIERLINFDKISELALTDTDHVYCCLGTTINKVKTKEAFEKIDKEYVSELAKLAERAGCQKFIVISSIGANKNSNNFYLRTKGEMEEKVKSCSIPAIYILQPSMLLGKRKEFRLGEKIGKLLMVAIEFLFIGKMRKYRGIKASTVAKAMTIFAKRNNKGVFIVESDEIARVAK
jgi:uncharacterized protein YbjT (DUF2867 family)